MTQWASRHVSFSCPTKEQVFFNIPSVPSDLFLMSQNVWREKGLLKSDITEHCQVAHKALRLDAPGSVMKLLRLAVSNMLIPL